MFDKTFREEIIDKALDNAKKWFEMGAYTEAEYERRVERIKRTPEPFQPGKCYCGLALSCPLHSEIH